MAIRIYAIDIRDYDHQPHGKIIQVWQVHDDEPPGPRYADYCALYGVWGAFCDEPPSHIGFFGYRKYLMAAVPPGVEPAHAPGWYQCDEFSFDRFREAYADDDGSAFLPLLATHDILVAPPYPVDDVIQDFRRSRSPRDAQALFSVVNDAGWSAISDKIYPYLFITRWEVFDRAMH